MALYVSLISSLNMLTGHALSQTYYVYKAQQATEHLQLLCIQLAIF